MTQKKEEKQEAMHEEDVNQRQEKLNVLWISYFSNNLKLRL